MPDGEDVCPHNNLISRTSFYNAIRIKLDKVEQSPLWDYIGVSIYHMSSVPSLHCCLLTAAKSVIFTK